MSQFDWWGARVVAVAAMLSAPTVVAAQVTQAPAPTPQLPSRAQVEQPAPPVADRATARVSGRGAVPTPPCPLASSPLKVTITSVRFVAAGRDAVPEPIAAVLAGVGPTATGEQPLAAVCAIRDAANAALTGAGYVASVQVPPQEITDGTLTLSIVLARITEIRVHGEAGAFRPILERTIERLRALDPLNERDAERLLLLTGDVPGLDVQLALRPAGSAPGDVIGDLNVATQRVSFLGNAQNYGSKALGRETAYLRADLNSVVVAGDTLYVGGSTTAQFDEQQVAQFGYRAILNGSGLSAGPRFTYAWSQPDIGVLELRSRSIIAGFDVFQPIVRSVRRNLSATFGFEAIEQRIETPGTTGFLPLNRDRLRELFMRIDGRLSERRFDGLDAFSIDGALEIRRGLDIFNATQKGRLAAAIFVPSRIDGDPRAFIMRGSLAVLARFTPNISIVHSVLGQWTNSPLLNFDEQAVGNLTVGMGYDPGATSGDRFLGLHSEIRFDITAFKTVGLQFYAFGDNVWLWNLDPFSIENDRHLRSIGAGVRARLPGPMLLEITYARPLDRALAINDDRAPARVLVSLTAQFSPRFP